MKNRKTNFILLMLSSVVCFTACNIFGEESAKNADQLSVKIGTQEWTNKNLNVSTFKNGDAIPQAKTNEEWDKARKEGKPAWSYYDNDPKNGDKYGKLYNWYAVNDPRGLAPSGWHVPSDGEWTKLTDFLGGEEVANKMKSKEGWDGNDNSSNESGFSALPGGSRSNPGGFGGIVYEGIGYEGFWWSSTQGTGGPIFNDYGTWFRWLMSDDGFVDRYVANDSHGFSVRCIRD